MVIGPGSKGRNREALIKMLNKDGNYRRKGDRETVGGRKRGTVPFVHGFRFKGGLVLSQRQGPEGTRQ